jgi:hypothetical protein
MPSIGFMKMTNEELLILEHLYKLHIEAKQAGRAFHAIAIKAEPDSEVAKQFKILANNAFNLAKIFYRTNLTAK